MDTAKIQLSKEEKELVSRADWILTKNQIIQKVMALLGSVQEVQHDILQEAPLPSAITNIPAKISRGENYRGLPWLILDQPRLFNKEDVFAIRQLFWWGHYFSSTLHLSGAYKEMYQEMIIASYGFLAKENFYIGIHADPWHHYFEEDNLIAINQLSQEQFSRIIFDHFFLKLSKKILLEKWDDIPQQLQETFKQYLSMLEN